MLKRNIALVTLICMVLLCSGTALAENGAETASAPAAVTASSIPGIDMSAPNYDELNIASANDLNPISPDEIADMEGDSRAAVSGQGGFTPMAQVGLDNYGYGSITNTLTSSNPYDFLLFSFANEQNFILRFTSTNSNYKANLCLVDGEGYIYRTSISYLAGAVKNVIIPGNSSEYPMYCWLIESSGTVGQSYKFEFNKTAFGDLMWVSDDLTTTMHQYGDTFYLNNDTLYNVGGSYSFRETYNQPTQISAGGNTYGGYIKVESYLDNTRLRRWSDGSVMASAKPVRYSGAFGSSSCAILLAVGEDTLCTMWYKDYMSGPYGWSTGNNSDWLGNVTPLRFSSQHVNSDGTGYVVIDAFSGEMIDYYGNGNAFYAYGFYNWPTITNVPGLVFN